MESLFLGQSQKRNRSRQQFVDSAALVSGALEMLTGALLPFQISWGRDIEVLTGGLTRFTDDRRFQPLHREYSEDWALRILSVRASDAGWYFCQLSTSPPLLHHIYLTVVGE